jgi:hypothetical protein
MNIGVAVELSTGQAYEVTTFSAPNRAFWGFTTDTPVEWLKFTGLGGGWPAIDNLAFIMGAGETIPVNPPPGGGDPGGSTPPPVMPGDTPEPGTMVMLASGVGLIAFSRYRSRRRSRC